MSKTKWYDKPLDPTMLVLLDFIVMVVGAAIILVPAILLLKWMGVV